MAHVLILFQANTERVEQLALAVAVGAVEAEGLIRLRRLAAPDAPEVGHKSYGKLQAADLLWADVLVVGLEAAAPNPAELGPLVDLLKETPLMSKRGWTFGPNGPDAPSFEAQSLVAQAFQASNITLLPLTVQPSSGDLIARMKLCGHLSASAWNNS
jgi:hypothetical protein